MRIQPRIGTGLWGLVMTVLVVAAAPTWASETTAKIVKVQGLVEVSSASSGQWVSAPGGRVLRPGDAVRTGSRSSAIITLGGAEVTLYETTLLRIPISTSRVSTAGDSPWRHPSLDQGRGLFNVTPGRTPAGFSVRTPMLVAGVKGTIFEVIATGTEHAVYVWEGAVEVSSLLNPTDLQLVAAGEHTMMDDLHLTPSQPMPVERERPEGAHRDGVRPDVAPEEERVQKEPLKQEDAFQKEERIENQITAIELQKKHRDQAAVLDSWREADRIAVDLASDGMADFQTIISSGELRQPVTVTLSTTSSSTPSTSASATTTPTHAASTVTDPVASSVDTTLSTVTDPLLSTVDTTVPTPTDPLLATTVTDPVASSVDTTLSTVTDPLLSTVDTTVPTMTDPLLSTIDTTTTSVIDPLTGSTTQLVDSASGLLGL